MSLSIDAATDPFCDWLDITAPPAEEDRLSRSLGSILCAAGAEKVDDGYYRMNGGTVKLGLKYRVFRASVSGSAIRLLEVQGLWGTFLSEIGDGPHRVTRLDAAIDLPLDGADALAALRLEYPRGQVRISQRPVRVTEMTCVRADGRTTGTWYAGHRSGAEVTCRVYDKAQQLLDTRGEVIPPRTRVELTVRKGSTLRDAMEPARIFWHYIAPSILKPPVGVPEWSSGWAEGWTMDKVDILPAQRLKNRIERSPELAAIIELADSLGPAGRDMALRLIEQRVRSTPVGESPAGLEEAS